MKKAINITLAKLVFSLEEDAYQKLYSYLESLKAHFSSQTYAAEVMSDIESRIAEQFSELTKNNSNRAITLEEVETIIKSIGTSEDFTDEPKNQSKNPTGKKLYRNSEDVVIAGVASGIAAYFGWDTTIVRVLFIITVLLGGWGLILYLLLALVMPEAKTASQKLEMQGAPVTIKQFEQTAKEKIHQVRQSGFFQNIFYALGKIIRIFGKIVLAFAGAVITFFATIAALGFTVAFANLLFNRNSPYIDWPFNGIFHGVSYAAAILLGFVLVVIPLIFIALAGISLLRRRWIMNKLVAGGLVAVWIISGIAATVIGVNKAPEINAAVVAYQGNVESRTLDVRDFDKIDASGLSSVIITSGKDYAVSIKGHTRDLDSMQIQTKSNNELLIGRKNRFCLFCFDQRVEIQITMPKLTAIEASGATAITLNEFMATDLAIDLSGASRLTMAQKLTVENLELKASGASKLQIIGTTKKLTADLSGASSIDAFELIAEDVTVKTSGASNANIHATKTASFVSTGSSDIRYMGSPQILRQNDSGSSSIESAE